MLFQSGYQFSAGNYDMTCGYVPNYFNLKMNTFMADSIARMSLYNFPTFNMGSMIPYGGVSIPGDFIFGYTLNQAHYNSLQNGGNGLWDKDGNFNILGYNPSMGAGYGMGAGYSLGANYGAGLNPFMPWINSDKKANDKKKTDAEREAEAKMQEDYETIKRVLTAYQNANADEIDSDLRKKLDNAISKTGDIKDRYKAVKDVYLAIDKDSLRKVFPTMDDYRENLINVGFDFEDSDYALGYGKAEREAEAAKLKTDLDDIYDELKAIRPGDEAFTASLYNGKFTSVHEKDILNYLSLWNEKYNDEGEKLLELVIAKLPTTDNNTDADQRSGKRSMAVDTAVVPLVLALTSKANAIVNTAKGVDVKPLTRQAQSLNRALAKFKDDSFDTEKAEKLVAEFDTLYVMLRKYEAHLVDKKIASDYKLLNELDKNNQVALNGKIMEATVADLESEGLGEIKFEVKVKTSGSGNKFTAQEEMDNFDADKYAVEKVQIGTSTCYVELLPTGDRETKRIFQVVGNEIKVVGEYDKEGKEPNFYAEDKQVKISAKTIERDYDKALIKKEEKEYAKEDGDDFAYSLYSNGTANIDLTKLDKNNIYEFLDGIYNAETGSEGKRFFTKAHKEGIIDVQTGKKIMKAVLAAAEEAGATNYIYYKNLKEIYEKYTNGDCRNKTDFKKFNWNYMAGDMNYIDQCIINLYTYIGRQKIKLEAEA